MAAKPPNDAAHISLGPVTLSGRSGPTVSFMAGILIGTLSVIFTELWLSWMPGRGPGASCTEAVRKLNDLHRIQTAVVTRLAQADSHGVAIREQLARLQAQTERILDRTAVYSRHPLDAARDHYDTRSGPR